MLIFLTLVYAASATEMNPFIVGGVKASIADWPFIAFIEVQQFEAVVSACGGSLISSQTVLTAAHCLDDVTETKTFMFTTTFTIFMGHTRFDEATMTRKVLEYETHNKYDPDDTDVRYDIGVMFLEEPVEFLQNVKKVILQRRFNVDKDQQLEVAGWGVVDPEGSSISKRLKSLGLRPMPYEKCKELSRVICTSSNGKEYAFSGDSGGPMINAKTRQQLGIVSFRDEGTGVTVFTSVPDYWNWINRTQMNLFTRHCGN